MGVKITIAVQSLSIITSRVLWGLQLEIAVPYPIMPLVGNITLGRCLLVRNNLKIDEGR